MCVYVDIQALTLIISMTRSCTNTCPYGHHDPAQNSQNSAPPSFCTVNISSVVILHKKLVTNWLLDISNLRRILTKVSFIVILYRKRQLYGHYVWLNECSHELSSENEAKSSWNLPRRKGTHCSTLYCNTLKQYGTFLSVAVHCNNYTTRCNTLQHTAIRCNTL